MYCFASSLFSLICSCQNIKNIDCVKCFVETARCPRCFSNPACGEYYSVSSESYWHSQTTGKNIWQEDQGKEIVTAIVAVIGLISVSDSFLNGMLCFFKYRV